MAIIILEDIDKIAMKDGIDIRSFKKDEVHVLAPWNEEHLIMLGLAAVAIPADAETAAAVSESPADEPQVLAEADSDSATPEIPVVAEEPAPVATVEVEPATAE